MGLLNMYQVYNFPFSKIHGRVANKEHQDKVLSPNLEHKSKKKNSKIRREPGKNLHKNAYKILEISAENYTTHCWRRYVTTNLADKGVSFINLKRHGQRKSDSVVKGYIANSESIRKERKHAFCQ